MTSTASRRLQVRLACTHRTRAAAVIAVAILCPVLPSRAAEPPSTRPHPASHPVASRPSSLDARENDALRELLDGIRTRHKLPALGGAIVDLDGVRSIAAVGIRRHGSAEAVTPHDLFHIGSCTKAMTSTVIARLIEEGTLDWTTTPADVFPELSDAMDPAFRKATLELLLTHRAGAPADLNADGLWARLWERRGSPIEQRLDLLRSVLARPPVSEPGRRYLYSNAGYAIAGAIAERKTGLSWEDLMRRKLFEPLGMKSAGFGAPGAVGGGDVPWGHVLREGKLTPIEPGPMADNPPAIAPAGTVHCTLSDWGRFVALHLRGSKEDTPLLKRDAFHRLHTPSRGADYAMGWIVTQREWGGTVLTHAGSNTMWYGVVWMAPQKDFAVLAVTNLGDPAATHACDEAAWQLIQHVLTSTEKRQDD